ncbi:hypothetical protein ACFOD0_04100 [Shewanella intestini]|uniref:DUF4342 domain-containing protein n=1 Tax=Shewanella intestini TaxID=2017544 RepID=A0ABS5I3H0_9GAMM|nr:MULTISPECIES: hypothetical protein [Shewanella]MBR9728451.1 hypothetical protein [Shewanella intestini]MRG36270.1 hypothetical protein [Shewanella sp. XMDDZSB0408]
MNIVEYKAMKKLAITQLGADDAESLNFYAEKIEKQSKMIKWMSIILGITSLPLCLIIIGFPILISSVLLYFFSYKKVAKKARMFKEYINNDPELSSI